ncbi:MAG TPA: TolC family protein [Gammaproteobacteria bacterium]
MRVFPPLAGLILFLSVPAANAAEDVLSLPAAEALAIQRDAERDRLEIEAEAQAERAVAAGSLPDPELRLGVMNLPVDSLALDAEPMTQAVIGIRQMLPPGDTLDLRTERGRRLAGALRETAAERARQVRLAVREAWFNALTAAAMRTAIDSTRDAVAPLLAAAESRYSTGSGGQVDFLAAQLRLDRLAERGLRVQEQYAVAIAMLRRWLAEVPETLAPAELPPPAAYGELVRRLPSHPLLEAAGARIAAGETGEDIVRETFGPQWGVDFSYGARRGVDAMGRDRPDFASVMVTMSLPLFTGNRQDRELAAAMRETNAARSGRENLLRELAARLDTAWRRHEQISRQLALLDDELLPSARRARESALDAYAANALVFADLVDIETDLLELELRRLELLERQQLARAEIYYLAGEPQ